MNGSTAFERYIPEKDTLDIRAGDTYALDTRLNYGMEIDVNLIDTLTITPEWSSHGDSSITQGETMDLRINHFEH